MIKKPTLILLLSAAAFAGNVNVGHTQAPTDDTQQTDQSEEAWRKSKKKTTSPDPFNPFQIKRSTGSGDPLPPMKPIDNLPEESRRHIMRERAKVIAETKIGEDPAKAAKDKVYDLSEAAKSDPELAAQEREAWEVIVTDMQSSGQSDPSQGKGGPHKVAVAGQGGNQSSSVMRGGSTQSAAEIMAILKGMKEQPKGAPAPAQSPGTTPQSGQSTNTGSASGRIPRPNIRTLPGMPKIPRAPRIGKSPTSGTTPGDVSAGRQASGDASGQGSENSPSPASMNQGSPNPSGQTATDQGQVGQGPSDQGSSANGQDAGSGQNSGMPPASGSNPTNSAPSILGPLSGPQDTGPQTETSCSQSSASDYLRRAQGGASGC